MGFVRRGCLVSEYRGWANMLDPLCATCCGSTLIPEGVQVIEEIVAVLNALRGVVCGVTNAIIIEDLYH